MYAIRSYYANEEQFIKNLNVFSNLKLRAGYGRIGNQAIKPYQTFSNYAATDYATPSNGLTKTTLLSNIANEDLVWETTEQYNAGIDFGIFNNRITGTLDVYTKKTRDLLQAIQLPTSTGFESMQINRGTLSNKGLEIAIDGVIVDDKDFNLTLGGNISFNKSKIVELGIPDAELFIGGSYQQKSYYLGNKIGSGSTFNCPANIFVEGEEIGLFYGFQTDGIYQTGDVIAVSNTQPGDIRIIDQNSDGLIDGNDRTIIGNPNPDFVFGINLSATYKRFTFSAAMNGVYGNDVANVV